MNGFLQATLDALTTCIAVLDQQGKIVVTNKAWRSFSDIYPESPLSLLVSDNHIPACGAFDGVSHRKDASSIVISSIKTGIREVLGGQRDAFSLDYEWSTGAGERWFSLCVTRFKEKTEPEYSVRLVVAQDEITKRKQAENALRDNEVLLRLATEAGGVGLWEWELATNRQNWNPELKTIFGLPSDHSGLTTDNYISAIHPEDVEETEHIFRTALEQRRNYEHSYRIVRPDGSVRWIAARGRGYYDEAGRALQMRGAAVDITQVKLTEEALRESEARFRNSFISAAIGKALVTLDGRCLQVNQALCNLLGYSEAELLQLTFEKFTHREDFETDLALLNQLVRGTRESYQLEKRYLHKRGHEVWGLLSVSVVRDRQGNPLYFVSEVVDVTAQMQNINQLQQANAQLHDLAHDDALTGLKNRRAFDEQLKQAVATAKRGSPPFSVLLLDLDHFKHLNDSHGHAAGDEVLQTIGRLLRQVMRPSDFVARYGGEEFALILPSSGVEGAIQAAERTRRAIAQYPWTTNFMTASVGVATWTDEDAQTLLVKADLALYAAKAAGRNRVHHHSNCVHEGRAI